MVEVPERYELDAGQGPRYLRSELNIEVVGRIMLLI